MRTKTAQQGVCDFVTGVLLNKRAAGLKFQNNPLNEQHHTKKSELCDTVVSEYPNITSHSCAGRQEEHVQIKPSHSYGRRRDQSLYSNNH